MECQKAGIIVCCHVKQYMVGLADRLNKAIEDGALALNGLEVIHAIDSLTLEDEIRCADALWIRKNIDTVAMLNSTSSSIEQQWIVLFGFTDGCKDICLILYLQKLLPLSDKFQLASEIYTSKYMEPCQFQGNIITVLLKFFHEFLNMLIHYYVILNSTCH